MCDTSVWLYSVVSVRRNGVNGRVGRGACCHSRCHDPATAACRAQRWHELLNGWASFGSTRDGSRGGRCRNAEEALMAIVAGFDVHRRQITFDSLDTDTVR